MSNMMLDILSGGLMSKVEAEAYAIAARKFELGESEYRRIVKKAMAIKQQRTYFDDALPPERRKPDLSMGSYRVADLLDAGVMASTFFGNASEDDIVGQLMSSDETFLKKSITEKRKAEKERKLQGGPGSAMRRLGSFATSVNPIGIGRRIMLDAPTDATISAAPEIDLDSKGNLFVSKPGRKVTGVDVGAKYAENALRAVGDAAVLRNLPTTAGSIPGALGGSRSAWHAARSVARNLWFPHATASGLASSFDPALDAASGVKVALGRGTRNDAVRQFNDLNRPGLSSSSAKDIAVNSLPEIPMSEQGTIRGAAGNVQDVLGFFTGLARTGAAQSLSKENPFSAKSIANNVIPNAVELGVGLGTRAVEGFARPGTRARSALDASGHLIGYAGGVLQALEGESFGRKYDRSAMDEIEKMYPDLGKYRRDR